MNQVVLWSELSALVKPFYTMAGIGCQLVGLAIMLRTYFLRDVGQDSLTWIHWLSRLANKYPGLR
jgi:hypothetical protein